jgi:hypothetical protein
MSHFAERLREVINQHCRENASNTPDFILSEYLFRCLDAFDAAVRERDHWHHLHPTPWTTGKVSQCCVAYEKKCSDENSLAQRQMELDP